MIHYISSSAELTGTEFNAEISSLKESINADRNIYFETLKKEHEEYLHRLNDREDAFQDMIVSFRNAAAASEKTKIWWQFWRWLYTLLKGHSKESAPAARYPTNDKETFIMKSQKDVHSLNELLIMMDLDYDRVDFRLDELELQMEHLRRKLEKFENKIQKLGNDFAK